MRNSCCKSGEFCLQFCPILFCNKYSVYITTEIDTEILSGNTIENIDYEDLYTWNLEWENQEGNAYRVHLEIYVNNSFDIYYIIENGDSRTLAWYGSGLVQL
jgi:hypothetical protein